MGSSNKKYIYSFQEGRADMKSLLGGKGANLAEMTNIGLPVPPGFTISTEACNDYNELGLKFPEGLEDDIQSYLTALEKETGKTFGDAGNPLLVSVRSGAVFSMPGMMDTILNLGLNDVTVEGLAAASGNPRFAYDCYRRFIQMFSNVVLRIELRNFEHILERHKEANGIKFDYEIGPDLLKKIIEEYKALVKKETKSDFPQDPRRQLIMAIRAVFDSWNNPRAQVYRKLNKISDSLGTAVNICAMVFGNMGHDSGTGVVFTRNPNTGSKEFYGEFLTNAQGEDVVAGIRTPRPIAELKTETPDIYEQLYSVCQKLELHYKDMQDIEFTVERGKLYMLQTRNGKRTATAAVKIAVDLVKEGLITKDEAILRVEPAQLEKLLHRGIDPNAKLDLLGKGLPASPGAATGAVVFDSDEAEQIAKNGEKVILVRPETTPDDIHGMIASEGILTSRGGMTCHAAIVARGMGKPCIVGAESVRIDLNKSQFEVGGRTVKKGEVISIDGASGQIIYGEVPLVDPQLGGEFAELLGWADKTRRLGVWANADTPDDAAKAREFGAGGIGLVRTEHMFMAQDRLPAVQEMILSQTESERRGALAKLLPMQQGDFYGILKVMEGLPVVIRLLDPPLHEFLPDEEELAIEVALLRKTGEAKELAGKESLLKVVRQLSEFNPMLGFRGVRLGIVYPEIYEMQARAIFQAAAQLNREGVKALPKVMIPLISEPNEMAIMRDLVVRVAEAVKSETGVDFWYQVGACLETPRSTVIADEIARHAEFFSYGTNDMTQTTFGFSRDDAEAKFLNTYVERKVLAENPFITLDQKGVGKILKMGVDNGRRTRADLQVGICGEHGGEPVSVEFCHRIGLDYVSCSPFRVPIARLAAAHAKVKESAGGYSNA